MRPPGDITGRIRVLGGQLVILDVDLAELFGVEPKQLADLVQQNQTILSVELSFLVESNETPGPTRAYTEFGVIMAAGALNTPHAVQMSIQVVRAIVKMREALPTDTELARRIEALEKSVAALDAKTRRQFEEVYRMIRAPGTASLPAKPTHRELH